MGKNKFALKCFSDKIKCFKTMFILFFFNEKLGHRGPTQPAEWELPLMFFFLKPSLNRLRFRQNFLVNE